MAKLTISTLAQSAGVGVETVRYYQRRGLMRTPSRPAGSGSGGGIRRYDDDDVRRIRFIKGAQTAGFTLEEIDATSERMLAREMARSRIAALDKKIAALTSARSSLARLADQCSSGTSGPCPIITAFEPSTPPAALRTRA